MWEGELVIGMRDRGLRTNRYYYYQQHRMFRIHISIAITSIFHFVAIKSHHKLKPEVMITKISGLTSSLPQFVPLSLSLRTTPIWTIHLYKIELSVQRVTYCCQRCHHSPLNPHAIATHNTTTTDTAGVCNARAGTHQQIDESTKKIFGNWLCCVG